MREQMTSMVAPLGPPTKCSSSTKKSDTADTFLRCFHLLLSMSQRSGVAMMMLPLSSSFRSAADSPVSWTTFRPRPSPNFLPQSAARSLASASTGAMYTHRAWHLPSAARLSMRSSANSPQMVLPEPVGADTRALSSVLYSALKHCVWMGLKHCRPLYSPSNVGLRRALTGRGCRSNSSVGGGNFSGRMRCLKETGRADSHCSQQSLTTRMKYCGGTGSVMGTVKVSVCSSSAKDFLSTQYW
mmetsp:Transcript_19852/g.55358  ORF Transcript_19852/g.55358 Transcript_19852/m.55358 type:complete len:242 (-) Transcript_19852:3921-4646(-)